MRGATLLGTRAVPVDVEVDVSAGLPAFTIVGLADTAVLEARERVRSAIKASGYEFPNARVVVNLAPAPLRKHGTGFDLPIATAVLIATGQVPAESAEQSLLVGELGLDGAVRPLAGLLAHAVAAKEWALRLVCPSAAGRTLADATNATITPVQTLAELGRRQLPALECRPMAPAAGDKRPDLADVVGHQAAKRALEIAAAGGHNLLMIGPPGSGKTMLARRLAGLLPPLEELQRLETALVHSVAGIDEAPALRGERPFRAPHHSASMAGLVGGGIPPRPGEISLAHNGVLFLDELPHFGPATLQALRQPLEDGRVVLVRAEGRLVFPASFALVGAANPCPCGFFGDPQRSCTCAERAVHSYANRIGGPLMDRFDMLIRVDRIDPGRIASARPAERSAMVRDRVLAACARRSARGEPASAGLSGLALLNACRLEPEAQGQLEDSARQHTLSGRGVTRLLRVSRTIADLSGCDRVGRAHVLEAISLRTSL